MSLHLLLAFKFPKDPICGFTQTDQWTFAETVNYGMEIVSFKV